MNIYLVIGLIYLGCPCECPQWSHSIYQLISDDQSEHANDHLVRLNPDGTVSADGYLSDRNTHFKVYRSLFNSGSKVLLFESINGPTKGHMICIEDDELSSMKKKREYKTIRDAETEVQFERFQRSLDSMHFGLKLLNSNPPQYMGFYGNGKALQPSRVNISRAGAYFLFKPVK